MTSDAHLAFDMMKFRIESTPYFSLARAMKKMGATDFGIKMLLQQAHGITFQADESPIIFFIVTDQMEQSIQQDLEHSNLDGRQRDDQIFASKIGTSPAMGLDKEQLTDKFKGMIAQHNSL